MSEDLTAPVNEALRRTPIMALSTIGDDGSWTTPVQYTHDNQLNLFFLSLAGATTNTPDTDRFARAATAQRRSRTRLPHAGGS